LGTEMLEVQLVSNPATCAWSWAAEQHAVASVRAKRTRLRRKAPNDAKLIMSVTITLIHEDREGKVTAQKENGGQLLRG